MAITLRSNRKSESRKQEGFALKGETGNGEDLVMEFQTFLRQTSRNDVFSQREHQHGDRSAAATQAEHSEDSDQEARRISELLYQIADEMRSNLELQRMINDSARSPTPDVFMRVATEIFSDGQFNWGRVVVLFYFACRLVIKAVVTKVPDIIRTIISWTMDYLRENVISWIREQGGWEGIRSHFDTPTWQTVGVFSAGVFTTFLVIDKT